MKKIRDEPRPPGSPNTPQGGRADETQEKSRWTARFVLRLAGIIALAAVVLMALIGAYVLDFTDSAEKFILYWSVFFFLLLGVISLAILDTVLTMIRFARERRKLRRAFTRELARRNERL